MANSGSEMRMLRIDDCPEGKFREVPASEILDKILRGEDIEYDCVIVKGDLDLSNLDLPTQHIERTDYQKEELNLPEEVKLVKSKIKIAYSWIKSLTASTIFIEPINFKGSIFCDDADFKGSRFNENAYFGGSTFNQNADFKGSAFSGYAYFGGSTFNQNAYFDGSTFVGNEFFNGSKFSGIKDFSGSKFSNSGGANMAHSILIPINYLIKAISIIITLKLLYPIFTFVYNSLVILSQRRPQMNSLDDLIVFISPLFLISIVILILLIAPSSLEYFWRIMDFKMMKFNANRSIIGDYVYLFDEEYYSVYESRPKREKELIKILTYLKNAKKIDELAKLKYRAMNIYANGHLDVPCELFRAFFTQIGMTDEQIESERQQFRRPEKIHHYDSLKLSEPRDPENDY